MRTPASASGASVPETVLVLFGTQTGNSELLAGDVLAQLRDAGLETRLVDMADAYPELLEEAQGLVAVLCTWADGTFPDNAIAFWDDLNSVRPDCSQLGYGIVGLGDRLYEPYYQVAAYDLAERLDELGASRLTDHLEIDGPVRPSHRRLLRLWVMGFVRAMQKESTAGP